METQRRIFMKRSINISEAMDLTVAQRIELVEDLWDSIAAIPEKVDLTNEQKKILDERLEAFHQNPTEGSPWEEVKDRIQHLR
jgi:putative addiction module component (TIGR02574 family)